MHRLEHISASPASTPARPKGPWNYGGQIVDNGVTWNGGNDSRLHRQLRRKMVCVHRRTTNDYNRQGAIEPIELRIRR